MPDRPTGNSERKKKILTGTAIGLISLVAAFELGRVSWRDDVPVRKREPLVTTAAVPDDRPPSTNPGLTPSVPVLPVMTTQEPLPVVVPLDDVRPAAKQAAAIEESVSAVEAPPDAPPAASAEPALLDEPSPANDSTPMNAVPAAGTATLAPTPDPDARYAFDEVDRPPGVLSTQLPMFDIKARKSARGQHLDLELLVAPGGRIGSVRVVAGIDNEELRRVVVGAVLRWRFTEGSHHGVPVRVWVPVRLDFVFEAGELRAAVTSPAN